MQTLTRWVSLLTVACLALLGIGALSVHNATRAFAASQGTGIDFDTVGYLGSFELASGEHAYCVEIKVWEPWDEQKPVTTVTSLPAFGGDLMIGSMLGMGGVELDMPAMKDAARMRHINYIISTWGNTQDHAQAAAVALAVFAVRGDPIGYNDALQDAVAAEGGSAVVKRSHEMVVEAQTKAVAAVQGEKTPAPVLTLNDGGTGTLEYFPGTHTLKLSNAVFTDTGNASREVASQSGGVLDVQGIKPEGWDASYEVRVTADWASGRDGWRAELNLHEPTKPAEQRIVTPTGMTTGFHMSGSETASATVTRTWAPRITTQVQDRVLQVGDRFIDDVTVSTDERWGEWSTDATGMHMPLSAEGTLYGPLTSDPSAFPQDEAPADAPVATVMTLDISDGPGTYTATAPGTAYQSGYYTWVWRMTWEGQRSEVTAPARTGTSALERSAFPVVDGYGVATETHLVQQRMTLTTRVLDGEIGLGWSLIDDVSVNPEQFGGWIYSADDEPIPVVLRGTVYHSDEAPIQAPEAPENARIVADTSLTVSHAGIYESDPIALPLDTEGFVTIQWCIHDEDQAEAYRGITREWCDDYGVPAETARVTAPTVSTLAQPEAEVTDMIYDEAIVEGLVPNAARLSFAAYLYPEVGKPKYDETWQATGETWSASELAALSEVDRCLIQPVAMTESQSITEAGTYRSPDVLAQSAGIVHWVETLTADDPTTDETVIVHEGECGLVNETTLVTLPPEPELATTGGPNTMFGFASGAAVFVLAGMMLIAARRKPHQH